MKKDRVIICYSERQLEHVRKMIAKYNCKELVHDKMYMLNGVTIWIEKSFDGMQPEKHDNVIVFDFLEVYRKRRSK